MMEDWDYNKIYVRTHYYVNVVEVAFQPWQYVIPLDTPLDLHLWHLKKHILIIIFLKEKKRKQKIRNEILLKKNQMN